MLLLSSPPKTGRLQLSCAILMMMMMRIAQALAFAMSDTQVTSAGQANDKVGQQRPPRSCYVCSTTDYENPANNLCRTMKKNHPKVVGLQSNAGPNIMNQHHPHSMSYPPTDSTYTQTTATTTDNNYNGPPNVMKSASGTSDGLVSSPTSPGYYDEYGTPLTATTQQYSSTNNDGPNQLQSGKQSNGGGTLYNSSNTAVMHPSTYLPNSASTSASSSHYGYFPQGRPTPPPGDIIRTRPCSEGENFCSIVSVVRIEFVNENAQSIFWAMERNCSKSCNTGCMLIGERVRLRVCSQCCRTSNCNIGSGAAAIKLAVAPNSLQLIMLLLSLVSIKLLFFHEYDGLR